MSSILKVLEFIVALLLIGSIIMQSRGTSGGMAFGGNSESYRSKRGLEKILFYATIVLAAFFALLSILALINK